MLSIFGFAVVLVYLVLAALYENWSLPFGIILALFARFETLQVVFQVVEKTHLTSRYDSRDG